MNTRKYKSDVPEAVIDHCIDNKLTVAEGLIQLIDKKFESADRKLKSLKHDVTTSLGDTDKSVTDDDIKDVEAFLNNFNNNNSK
jgi:hypothetical protein